MYPSQSVGMGLHTLTSVRRHYNLADEVWQSFVDQAADPQDDLKLLGSLPASVVAAALAQARLHHSAPLTAVQAAHAGLVFSLTRRILHTLAGGDWDSWTEVTPFADATPPARTQTEATQIQTGN